MKRLFYVVLLLLTQSSMASEPSLYCTHEALIKTFDKKGYVIEESTQNLCLHPTADSPLSSLNDDEVAVTRPCAEYRGKSGSWRSQYSCLEGNTVKTICASSGMGADYSLIQSSMSNEDGTYAIELAVKTTDVNEDASEFDPQDLYARFKAKPNAPEETAACALPDGNLVPGQTLIRFREVDMTLRKEGKKRTAITGIQSTCRIKGVRYLPGQVSKE